MHVQKHMQNILQKYFTNAFSFARADRRAALHRIDAALNGSAPSLP
jgi:hypothetical protein